MACLEYFTMRRFYHDALAAISVVVIWMMPHSMQRIREANPGFNLTGSHY